MDFSDQNCGSIGILADRRVKKRKMTTSACTLYSNKNKTENAIFTPTLPARHINLEYEINVTAGINMPAGTYYINNKRAGWKV